MKINTLKANRVVQNEEQASKHINILTHYNNDTLLDKSGKLIKIIKLHGLNFVTKDKQTLDTYKIRRNNLLKNFSSEFALYFWQIRRKLIQYPAGEYQAGFANIINEKYKTCMHAHEMFHEEQFIAVIAKHPEGMINKFLTVFSRLSYRLDKQSKQEYLARKNSELHDATQKILSAFSDYQAEVLSIYKKKDALFSAPLELISQLVNFEPHAMALKLEDVATVLPRKRLFFSSKPGVIEMRSACGSKKFAAVLSIKGYSPITYQGMLDEFSTLRIESTITQSFKFYDRQSAKSQLRNQQKEMMQSKEESISLTDQIDDAFDDAASGEVGYGEHHFTLVCYADSQDELNKHIGIIVAKFTDIDITCVREDVACEMGFWAQLPGNFSYIARPADISTKNMASLASLHNYPIGKIAGNHWGDAVTIFETMSGSPYYFNFHYKDVGNFLVFGAMGSGKTVLVGFLMLQSMKFGGKRIIFDKDRGLEILVRAMRGTYERIKPDIRTGFNPCHLEDTPENRHFLSVLFKKMLTIHSSELSERDIEVINQAVNGMYRLDFASRQLCHIASFFGAKKSGTLRARFDEWHSDGAHAWLFDNEQDSLNLNADVIGFDLGHILNEKECKTPALMYLLYRVEQAIAGERAILFCDEGWRLLDDDYFKEMINDWSRTPRKKNNVFGLATQVANDTSNSSISKSINESAFCKIFFPNASADKDVHTNELGLSEHEYHLIKTLPDDQHYFLLIFGRGLNKESVILKANLKGLEDVLAVISARDNTLMLLDQLLLEVGNDPNDWLPLFNQRRRGIV